MSIDARVDETALRDVVLTANLPAVTLEELAAPLGLLGTELLDVINLDVDRDGDGVNDAARLRIVGTPSPAQLADWR